MTEKRTNNGYEIIEGATIGNKEIVIGYNPKAPSPYVCWYCDDGNNYYWGYYCNELSEARKKLNERYQMECLDDYELEEKIPFGTGDGYIRFTKDKEVEIYKNGSSLYMDESDFYADLHKMDYQIALAAEKRKPKEEVTKSKKKAAR